MGRKDAFLPTADEMKTLKDTGEVEIRGTIPECFLGAPLIADGRVLGAVAIQDYHNKNTYHESDKDIMNLLAREISIAIERKRTSEALIASEKRLKLAGKIAYDLIYEWDVKTDKLQWFGDIDGMLGFGQGEISQNFEEWQRLIHPEDQKMVQDAIQRHRTSTVQVTYEYRISMKNGSIRHWNEIASPLKDEFGLPYKWIGVCRDITDRMKADGEIRLQSEIMMNIAEGVSIIGVNDETIKYVNPKFEEIFGYENGEMVGKHVSILNAPTDLNPKETANEIITVLNDTGEWQGEIKNIKKDGTVFWCNAKVSIINHTTFGKVFVSVHADITKRKQAEEALRDSEHRLRDAQKLAHIGHWVLNPETREVSGSEELFRIFGLGEDEATLEAFVGVVHPDDLEYDMYHINRGVEQGEDWDIEHRLITKDGVEKFVNAIGKPNMDGAGKVISVIGTVQDITERKQAEIELNETRLLLEKTFDSLDEAVLVVEIPSRIIITCNQTAVNMFGYSEREMQDRTTEFLHLNHEKYVQFGEELNSSLKVNSVYHVEFQHKLKNGGYIYTDNTVTPINDESGNITRVVNVIRDITEKKRAEQESLGLYNIIETSLNEIYIFDVFNLNFIQVNQVARENIGYSKEELRSLTPVDIKPEFTKETFSNHLEPLLLGEEKLVHFETIHRRKDKSEYDIEVYVQLSSFNDKPVFVANILDISEKKSLEAQFRQSQKMEAVGRLAGGIAHDFNNAMMVISGFNEMLMDSLEENDPMKANTMEVAKAAAHAADLTRQLLAFSRQQTFLLKVIDINKLIDEIKLMLQRLIGEDIILITKSADTSWSVKVDSSQMQQVMINLAVNARDAMPNGGHLTIETANTELDDKFCKEHPEVTPGSYVMVSTTDSGIGMSKEVSDKVFEPFFTTKEVDKGTGLGLSTVYGIIKQSGGYIHVDSEIGNGSTFHFFLPKVTGEVETRMPNRQKLDSSKGSERILVVEDDAMLRKYIDIVLQDLSYDVVNVENAEHAIKICKETDKPFDLILKDVVMPEMSGPELIKHIVKLSATVKVIFMSGHPQDKIENEIDLEDFNFLHKPFRPQLLADEVRRVLDEI